MKTYVLRRLFQLLPILLAITFLSFGMMRIAGSDVVEQKMENTGSDISQEVVDAAREELGLDKPFLTQYVVWLGGILRGDMGTSYVSGKPVFSTFISKLPATLLLTATSILLRRSSYLFHWESWQQFIRIMFRIILYGRLVLSEIVFQTFSYRFY